VDQLFAGWYGGLAVELMAMGKPVICYLREADLKCLTPEMRAALPIVNSTHLEIYDTLKLFCQMPRVKLKDLGSQHQRFFEHFHDPIVISKDLQQRYLEAAASRGSVN